MGTASTGSFVGSASSLSTVCSTNCLLSLFVLQVMKTYHMYHTESISAESKLKDAEKQEEKQFSKSGDLNVNLLRHEDRQPRRSSVRKIEKMKEKVRAA